MLKISQKDMQCEWKYRRAMAYATYGDNWGDSFKQMGEELKIITASNQSPNELAEEAIKYLYDHEEGILRYPAKSYAVAVVWAKLIHQHFGDNFWKLLKDKDLLPDDPFFETAHGPDEVVYRLILDKIGWNDVNFPFHNDSLPYLKQTIDYFYKEFMLDEKGISVLPRRKKDIGFRAINK